jgi:hypothetical protein
MPKISPPLGNNTLILYTIIVDTYFPIQQQIPELAERFEVAFNQIHSVLKRLNPHDQNDAFMKLLSEASRRHSYFQSFFVDLKQYAKLRNALVHEKLRMRTYIACPHEEVVLHIEKIARLLTAPAQSNDDCVENRYYSSILSFN